MAHNLFGDRMAFVGETPWHGLGKQVTETVTAAEMCNAAGLTWSVRKVPAPGARLIDIHTQRYDRYLIMRQALPEDEGEVALGMVGAGYEPLQNTEAFDFFEPFTKGNFARFHTAGALGNGSRVWVLAKLNGQIVIDKEDRIDKFLLLANSHDGSGAVTVRFTPIRVVCQNTLNLALERTTGVISIRHSKNILTNLIEAQAKELRHIIDRVFADAETLFGQMAARRMPMANVDAFLELLFPRTETQKRDGSEPQRWIRIKEILNDQKLTSPRTKDTLWGLYNAIVRDEDYRATREATKDARLDRIWFGSGNDLKLKLLKLCRDDLKKAA